MGGEHERTRIIFRNNLALALRAQHKLDEAEQLGHAWGLHALAEAHATNGDFEPAVKAKRQAIDALPADSPVRRGWEERSKELSAKSIP